MKYSMIWIFRLRPCNSTTYWGTISTTRISNKVQWCYFSKLTWVHLFWRRERHNRWNVNTKWITFVHHNKKHFSSPLFSITMKFLSISRYIIKTNKNVYWNWILFSDYPHFRYLFSNLLHIQWCSVHHLHKNRIARIFF